MTTAPQDNRGGDRPTAPQNNVGVSAVGGAGSKDGVPNINYTGFAYGQNKATNDFANSGMPMGEQTTASPIMAFPEVTPITAESANPDRPITYGMPFGPGAGSEVNPLPVAVPYQGDPSVEVIRAVYLQNPRNEDLRYIIETVDQQQQMVQ